MNPWPHTAKILAGEEGFEPPYPVLETGVLTVGRLPFTPEPAAEFRQQAQTSLQNFLARFPDLAVYSNPVALTSLLYAAYASGMPGKTSWSPNGRNASSCSLSWCNSGACSHHIAG